MHKPAQGEEMTPEMMQEVHRNAQAVSIIKGSLFLEEYRKVQGREDARDIWNILKMSHEGDLKAKRHRIEALESELARYDWTKGDPLQSLFDRLMVLVNKIRVLGSEDWSDSNVTRLFMRAYKEKDKSLARMIRDRNDYEEMTPHQLFAKIQQHESEEAPIKTRDTHALISNEQDSSKKNKDHKAKKVVETSSDEDSSSDEDTTMFIKTFKKFVRKNDKYKRKGKKRACYECGQTDHFIADCPNKKEQEAKKDYKKDKFKKGARRRDISRRRNMAKPTLVKNGTPMKKVLAPKKRKRWQTSPSNLLQARNSSPTSTTTPTLLLASWQKEIRYICLMMTLLMMMKSN
jgi:hypothetical protein